MCRFDVWIWIHCSCEQFPRRRDVFNTTRRFQFFIWIWSSKRNFWVLEKMCLNWTCIKRAWSQMVFFFSLHSLVPKCLSASPIVKGCQRCEWRKICVRFELHCKRANSKRKFWKACKIFNFYCTPCLVSTSTLKKYLKIVWGGDGLPIGRSWLS